MLLKGLIIMITILKLYALIGITWALILNWMSTLLPEDNKNKVEIEKNAFTYALFTIIFWLPIMAIILIHSRGDSNGE